MQSTLTTYLFFKDNTREVMTFYQSALGGKLTMQTYSEGQGTQDPAQAELIMHAVIETGSITLMAADMPAGAEYKPGNNFGLALSGTNEAELRGYWDKLSEGATITMPLDKSPWGDTFGMLKDKFGTGWMINISADDANDAAKAD